ncbi:MAG: hypothetical protein ACTSQF_09100 [Candidatus Heimdallarchaeaceae archaeon]
MSNYNDRSYQDFFKEELYGGFVQYLLDEYGARTINDLLRDDPLVTKKGFNFLVTRQLNEFLQLNPEIAKVFAINRRRCMNLRNIGGGNLAFPIDTEDDGLMVRENLRVSEVVPSAELSARATKEMKRSATSMKGQTIKGYGNEKCYPFPKRLTVHFKEGYATKIGKTTESFHVNSRSEAIMILLDRFEKKVAYATIQGEEEFCFVKPRNGKRKRSRKLRSQV